MVRANSQEIVQERLRNGGHNLFVQEGWMMSMGNKKVVKLFCRPLERGVGWFFVFQELELWMNLKQVTAIICPLCFVERDMFFVLRLYYAQNLHTDSHCPIVERHVCISLTHHFYRSIIQAFLWAFWDVRWWWWPSFLWLRCEGAEGKVSVCWDWDVKLEGNAVSRCDLFWT